MCRSHGKIIFILTLLFTSAVFLHPEESSLSGTDIPTVQCYSGSPLLLEMEVPDPDGSLTQVLLHTTSSTLCYHLPTGPQREKVNITVSPFYAPGVYDLIIDLYRGENVTESASHFSLQIGFVDFVWGRDNFKFGNNNEYKSTIGTYAEILNSWVTERFGGTDQAELVLLDEYMYSLFGKHTGRCYAFSGSELRYWRWPELLPRYYKSTYQLPAFVSRYQRDMLFLQFDVVYDFFCSKRDAGSIFNIENVRPQDQSAAQEEVQKVVDSITAGIPAVIGIIGPELHHSMLAYGFIRNPAAHTVDLLVANNWKSRQNANIRSLDAFLLTVYLGEDPDRSLLSWQSSEGAQLRGIDAFFAVKVKKEYQFTRDYLDALSALRLQQLTARNHAVLVIENAAEAWLTTGEDELSGLKNSRKHDDISGVSFEQINQNFTFEYPAGEPLWMEFTDNGNTRILQAAPGQDGSPPTTWTYAPDSGTKEEPEVRRLWLGPSGPSWESTPDGR